MTKLTTTCVGFDLLAHILATKNVAHIQPIFSEFTVFFAKDKGPSGGSQLSGEIIILWVKRRHFLACGCGPSCQPLHVQSTSDGCRSLTMLTTPCRAHPRWWTTARPRTATSQRWEDAGVESQTERCTRVNWFWCVVVRQFVKKNRRCGGVEGWPGQRWSSTS